MSRALAAREAVEGPTTWELEGEQPSARRGLRWWKEVLTALVFYFVYSAIRNTQGSASVSEGLAFRNARRIIRWEEFLGMYHEEAIQEAFISWGRALMSFWNLFYGTFHFAVTIAVLVLLFRRAPERYRRWRNVLAATTALALVGFALYPLMPPRLLPESYGYVDSLKAFGSPWSFDSAAMQKLSNQYAAMPSLHFAWALWCALAIVPALRRLWTRALAVLYPVLTLLAIVITGNHFVLDAVGGALVVAGGMLYAAVVGRGWLRWSRRSAGPEPATA
ncbi:MAG TPA: phosphatase PAP2 family protein [Acidimicrobiales bacterium]|nr:phosphatase PAP2 family protein [Acidimicrobiales bacterium]